MQDPNKMPVETPAGLILPPGTSVPDHMTAEFVAARGPGKTQTQSVRRLEEIVEDPERLQRLLDRLPRHSRRAYASAVKKGSSKVAAMLTAVARSRV